MEIHKTLAYTLISTEKGVEELARTLEKENIIGIDIECENNLHHYGVFITIIQISTKTKNFIVDIQELVKQNSDITPLKNVIENENICKIFHDISFDFRVLSSTLQTVVKNFFDTQIAAAFLNEKDLGLGSLLEKYFDFKKERKFQMADWTKRPISRDMLSYAIKDSSYLISLKELLEKKLREQGKLDFVKEECTFLEKNSWSLPYQTYEQFPKFIHLSDVQRGMVKELYLLREIQAKKVNRPIHFIINNKRIVEIVTKEYTLNDWKNITGVHPIVKSTYKEWFSAQEKGKKEPITIKRIQPKRATEIQKKESLALLKKRDDIAKKHNITPHLLLSKEQIRQIVFEKDTTTLRTWQKKLLEL